MFNDSSRLPISFATSLDNIFAFNTALKRSPRHLAHQWQLCLLRRCHNNSSCYLNKIFKVTSWWLSNASWCPKISTILQSQLQGTLQDLQGSKAPKSRFCSYNKICLLQVCLKDDQLCSRNTQEATPRCLQWMLKIQQSTLMILQSPSSRPPRFKPQACLSFQISTVQHFKYFKVWVQINVHRLELSPTFHRWEPSQDLRFTPTGNWAFANASGLRYLYDCSIGEG